MVNNFCNLKMVRLCDLSKQSCYENLYVKNELRIRMLAEDIKENGLREPISINKSNVILAGVERVGAVKLLKWEMIPALVYDIEDRDEMALFLLRSNNTVALRDKLSIERFNEIKLYRKLRPRGRKKATDIQESSEPNEPSREVVAKFLGLSDDKVKKLIKIGETEKKLFESIDRDIISLNQAYELVMKYEYILRYNEKFHKDIISELNEGIISLQGLKELLNIRKKTRESLRNSKEIPDHLGMKLCPICTHPTDPKLINYFFNNLKSKNNNENENNE